jgi:hypothetical protein
MDSPFIKANKLIALALDSGAGVEEARTAAYAAVRLIHQHQLLKESQADDFFRDIYSSPPPPPPKCGRQKKAKPKAKPKAKAKAKPKEPQQLSRAEIRVFAEDKADRFVSFLVKKSIIGEFPCLTARYLTEKALKNNEVHSLDRHIYHYYIQKALQSRVKSGLLGSRMGTKGGYHLVQSKKDPKGEAKVVGYA